MAFSKKGIVRIGSSQTNEVVFTVWAYNGIGQGIDDTLVDIKADGYFDDIVGDLSGWDRIHATGTEASETLQVFELTPTVKTKSASGVGSIAVNSLYVTTGGSTTEIAPVAGLVATDSVIGNMESPGPNNVTSVALLPGAAQVTLEFGADPGVGASVRIIGIRN